MGVPEAPMAAEVPLATATEVKSVPAGVGRKKRNILVVSAILLIIIIGAILIGVLISKNNDGGSSFSNKSVEAPGKTDATDPSGDPEWTTDPEVTIPPIDFGGETEATDPPQDPKGTTDPEVTIPPIDFEYYQSVGPLSVEVPISSPNSIGVFKTDEEAKSGISDAGRFLINNALLRIMGQDGFQDVALGGPNRGQGGRQPVFTNTGDFIEFDSGFEQGVTNNDLGNANGYDTNNQEDKVDQADVSKSEGKFIYTAFGDYLVVTSAEKQDDWKVNPEAQLVTKLQMPQIELPDQDYGGYPCYYPMPFVVDIPIPTDPVDATGGGDEPTEEIEDVLVGAPELQPQPEVVEAETVTGGSDFAASEPGMRSSAYYCRPPKPSIQSLLLSTNRLGVVVSGYGDPLRAELDEPTVIGNFLGTHLRLYDTSALDTTGELKLLGVQDIHGYFSEGYIIGNVAHIVTMSYINTWDSVLSKVEQWSNPAFANLEFDEYIATVTASAQQIADDFSDRVIKELSLSTGNTPKMATIGLDVDGELSDQPGFENILFGDGYLNSMVQISSFDANEASVKDETAALDEPELELEQTVKFLPTSWAQVYSASDKLVVAGQGSRWDPSRRGSEETTILFTFGLSGTVVTPEASGSVPGSLLNEYSIDYVGGYLRIATTIRNFWFVDAVFNRPAVFSRPILIPSTSSGSGMAIDGDPGGRALQEIDKEERFEVVGTCEDVMDTCADEKSMELCARVESNCPQSLFYSTQSCQFFCMGDYEDSPCPLPSESCLTVANFWNCQSLVRDIGCQNIMIPEACPFGKIQCADDKQKITCPGVVTNCFDEQAHGECVEMQRECRDMFIESDGCKVKFRCDDEPVEEPESRTLNQLFVLKISDTNSTKLEIVGSVSLGKPNEVFMSVRFFDHVAFFVTFEQIDPFYVVTFPDPATPMIQGELEISGFSSYLHSMNEKNTLLIGIGQETSADGRSLGLKVDLYDASIPTEPSLLYRYLDPDQWSSSGAEWDEKALRYVPFDDEHGLLVIPVGKQTTSINAITEVVEYGYFSGFSVFTVSYTDGSGNIEWLRDISHVEDVDSCFYCDGYTQDRTFVIDGKLISIHGKSVRSHDLVDKLAPPVWGFDFAWPDPITGRCCGW